MLLQPQLAHTHALLTERHTWIESTVIAQTAADQLGVPLEHVTVSLGDSELPAAPMSASSSSTASVCTVVAKACVALRTKLAASAVKTHGTPLHCADPAQLLLRNGRLLVPGGRDEQLTDAILRAGGGQPMVVNTSNNPEGAPPLIGPWLIGKGKPLIVGGSSHKDRVQYAFGAHFVELRVHSITGQITVPRVVSAFAAGRIMNPRTAKSQLTGGQVWGLSAALFEATEIDRRTARYTNDNLADYLLPVSADIGEITTLLVPEEDTLVNPLGIKGVGELGVVGLNAAVANALHHATAVRIRSLPIRVEKILHSPFMAL